MEQEKVINFRDFEKGATCLITTKGQSMSPISLAYAVDAVNSVRKYFIF